MHRAQGREQSRLSCCGVKMIKMSKKRKNRTCTKEHVVMCKGYRVRLVYQRSAHIGGLGAQIISIDGKENSGQMMLRLGHRLFMGHWHRERWADDPSERHNKERQTPIGRNFERWE